MSFSYEKRVCSDAAISTRPPDNPQTWQGLRGPRQQSSCAMHVFEAGARARKEFCPLALAFLGHIMPPAQTHAPDLTNASSRYAAILSRTKLTDARETRSMEIHPHPRPWRTSGGELLQQTPILKVPIDLASCGRENVENRRRAGYAGQPGSRSTSAFISRPSGAGHARDTFH